MGRFQPPPARIYRAVNPAEMSAPHDEAAEIELIGACFSSVAILDAVADMVSQREMYSIARGRVWSAMLSLRAEGRPVDVATVCGRLRERDELEAVGDDSVNGVRYVTALASRGFSPDVDLAHSYAQTIREMAHRRRIAEAMQVQLGEAYSGRTAHAAFVEGVETAIFNATKGFETSSEGVTISDLIAEEEQRIARIEAGEISSGGLPTGLESLDEKLGGLAPGEVTIVAGRPSMGKTALLREIAVNVAKSNHDGIVRGVLIFSLEMTRRKFMHRMVSAAAGVNLKRVIAGKLEGAEKERAARARAWLAALPIVIDDVPGLTVTRLRSRLRRAMLRFNGERKQIALVAIDQLPWMKAEKVYGTGSSDRSREIGDILKGCVEVGKETDVPMVIATQLSREVEKGRTGKALRPRMSDLAESGQIEMHAHNIVAVHRPEFYEPDKEKLSEEQKRLVEAILLKQRDGLRGIVRLDFEGEYARFRSGAT